MRHLHLQYLHSSLPEEKDLCWSKGPLPSLLHLPGDWRIAGTQTSCRAEVTKERRTFCRMEVEGSRRSTAPAGAVELTDR